MTKPGARFCALRLGNHLLKSEGVLLGPALDGTLTEAFGLGQDGAGTNIDAAVVGIENLDVATPVSLDGSPTIELVYLQANPFYLFFEV